MKSPSENSSRQSNSPLSAALILSMNLAGRKTKNTFKPGDEVVCLGDGIRNKPLDSKPTADCGIGIGKTGCVSGVSDCGDKVWVYDPSVNTGEEYEFHPSMICPRKQFLAKFPRAITAIKSGNGNRIRRSDEIDPLADMVYFPGMKGVMKPLPAIRAGVSVVQTVFDRQEVLDEVTYKPGDAAEKDSWWTKLNLDSTARQVTAEMSALFGNYRKCSAQAVQSRIIWQLLDRGKRLILLYGTLNPVTGMLFQMGQKHRTNYMARIISNQMVEADFPVITAAAGRLNGSLLRICDAREPDVFFEVLAEARSYFDFAVCDWKLSAREKAEVFRITRKSKIRFLCQN